MGDLHADDDQRKQRVTDLKLRDHLSWAVQKRPGGGPALKRSFSSASYRVGRTTSTTALRRTFTLRKSASIREGGYHRIHDDNDSCNGVEADAASGDHEEPITPAAAAEEEEEPVKDSASEKKRKSRFRRACQKLFGIK